MVIRSNRISGSSGHNSIGRVSAFQAERCRFKPDCPLQASPSGGAFLYVFSNYSKEKIMSTTANYTKEIQDATLAMFQTIEQKLSELEKRIELLESKKDE
tara:strand:+ start:382 stop:681 length:300 start_codon:yes stop_codon:yes gene_type:complete